MVHHVVYEHTTLLFNRHLDQLLLGALYGACKASMHTKHATPSRHMPACVAHMPRHAEWSVWCCILTCFRSSMAQDCRRPQLNRH